MSKSKVKDIGFKQKTENKTLEVSVAYRVVPVATQPVQQDSERISVTAGIV